MAAYIGDQVPATEAKFGRTQRRRVGRRWPAVYRGYLQLAESIGRSDNGSDRDGGGDGALSIPGAGRAALGEYFSSGGHCGRWRR